MLDGKKYAAMHETGEDVASCELFLTPKVSHLCSQHFGITSSMACNYDGSMHFLSAEGFDASQLPESFSMSRSHSAAYDCCFRMQKHEAKLQGERIRIYRVIHDVAWQECVSNSCCAQRITDSTSSQQHQRL